MFVCWVNMLVFVFIRLHKGLPLNALCVFQELFLWPINKCPVHHAHRPVGRWKWIRIICFIFFTVSSGAPSSWRPQGCCQALQTHESNIKPVSSATVMMSPPSGDSFAHRQEKGFIGSVYMSVCTQNISWTPEYTLMKLSGSNHWMNVYNWVKHKTKCLQDMGYTSPNTPPPPTDKQPTKKTHAI